MHDRKQSITMEDLEADFRMFGWDPTEVLRQLAQTNKELLRETLHEAGHCLAAWYMGFPVHEMDIRECESIKRGYKIVTFRISQARLEQLPDGTHFSLAVVCLAGLAAEEVMFRETFKRSAWKPDIDEAKDYLKKISGDEKRTVLFQSAMDVANKIVQENWSRIARLTVGAYHFGPVLNGEQILGLITGKRMPDQTEIDTPAQSN
jgi:hypothetical protein